MRMCLRVPKISRSKKGKKMEAVDDEAESSRIKLSDAAAGGVQDKADHPRGVAVDGAEPLSCPGTPAGAPCFLLGCSDSRFSASLQLSSR